LRPTKRPWKKCFVVIPFITLLFIVGCPTGPATDISDAWRKTLANDIDGLLRGGDIASANWRTVGKNFQGQVDDLASQIPDDIEAIIKGDLNQTIIRAEATATKQYMCGVDFTRDRVKSDLTEMKNYILSRDAGDDGIKRTPHICQSNPTSIDMTLPPEKRNVLEFYGYNFDTADQLRVLLEEQDGSTQDLSNKFNDAPDHYTRTLNLGGGKVAISRTATRFRLLWGGEERKSVAIVQPEPVDLVVKDVTFTPNPPQAGRDVKVTVLVRNNGTGEAGKFRVGWQSGETGEDVETIAKPQPIPGLKAGEEASVEFHHIFAHSTREIPYDPVATADISNEVDEAGPQAEANNAKPAPTIVLPRLANATVTFTDVTVDNDTDPHGNGEMWLDFQVNGRSLRWPNTGTIKVDDGQTYPINRAITIPLTDQQPLVISARGTDDDDPFDDDPMGSREWRFERGRPVEPSWEWGSHQQHEYGIRSNECDSYCFTLRYSIKITYEPSDQPKVLGVQAIPYPPPLRQPVTVVIRALDQYTQQPVDGEVSIFNPGTGVSTFRTNTEFTFTFTPKRVNVGDGGGGGTGCAASRACSRTAGDGEDQQSDVEPASTELEPAAEVIYPSGTVRATGYEGTTPIDFGFP